MKHINGISQIFEMEEIKKAREKVARIDKKNERYYNLTTWLLTVPGICKACTYDMPALVSVGVGKLVLGAGIYMNQIYRERE